MARLAFLLIFVALLNACTASETVVRETGSVSERQLDLVWPAPPIKERIRYLGSFSTADDLGYRESFSSRLKNVLGGGESPGMTRPYAIAVNEDCTLISDPGLGAVHVFDHKKKRYRLIKEINHMSLDSPIGIAAGNNRIFVADSALHRVFILDEKFRLIREIEQFDRPTGLAFDKLRKQLFVADTHAHKVMVFDEDGNWIQSIGSRGQDSGQFNFPTHLAIQGSRLFVNDNMNFRIQVFGLPTASYLSKMGEHGDALGYLGQPKGLAATQSGQVFVAESVRNRIQVFDMQGEFLMEFGSEGWDPGQFLFPAGLAVWESKLYVADSGNQRVQVFEYYGED